MVIGDFQGSFLPTEGIHNFRDYGGYRTADGSRVKRGMLFRSGQHLEASDEDLNMLQTLDIRTIIDLRGSSERESFPCRRHQDFDAKLIAFDGETSNSPPHEAAGMAEMTAKNARERMIAVYTRMPVNPAMLDMFSRYLKALAEREGASLVHCFAGKDRTGIAASLLLHILGVHRDDIFHEFLLTNDAPTSQILERQSLPRIETHYGKIDDQAKDYLMGVKSEYIETYFSEVTRLSGSLDQYIERRLGVDEHRKARLKERFVA